MTDVNVQDAEPRPAGAARQGRSWIALLIVVAFGATGVGWWYWSTWLPDRLHTVVDGKLYRSGELTPAHLERLQREYGIGRVVCLLNPEVPETQAEKAAAARLGIEWENVPLPGDGASTPADRARILELLTTDDAPPTLVHCAAGVNRTGLAIGLYRIRVQGWTYEQALAEAKAVGFEDLPKHENMRAALREAAAAR
jgi:protein tyrosine phosphatase (PTP) superfamily phosphohydrolase (DUF442 family)